MRDSARSPGGIGGGNTATPISSSAKAWNILRLEGEVAQRRLDALVSSMAFTGSGQTARGRKRKRFCVEQNPARRKPPGRGRG